jgi:transcriptional regulator with XRE-family HTH domain
MVKPNSRPRLKPNHLREWLEDNRVKKIDFAKEIGCTPSYLSMLLADDPPWPSRRLVHAIADATDFRVTANELSGISVPPPDFDEVLLRVVEGAIQMRRLPGATTQDAIAQLVAADEAAYQSFVRSTRRVMDYLLGVD